MASHCGNGDVIHAGTYFGDFLPALSNACGSTAKVWAFEPNEENYRCAQITLLLNGITNIELVRAGLGERSSVEKILTKDADGTSRGGASRVVLAPENAGGHFEQVSIVTIDESVPEARQVSIIQLDVEGFELQALAGALKTIKRCRPVLILEILADSALPRSRWFEDNIIRNGYEFAGMLHGNAVFWPSKPTPASHSSMRS